MGRLLYWLEQHAALLRAAGILSVVTFLTSLVVLPLLIARLPPDYFASEEAPGTLWKERHPVGRLATLVLKNVIGAALLVLGLAMLVLPGQGILTILASVMMLNFPGKRELELRLVRVPRVLTGLNWIRRKAKRAPLIAPPNP